MKVFFIFFLRLFVCFVAAKFLLRALDQDHRTYLIALTLIFTGNLYWFDFLEYRDRIAFRLRKSKKPPPPPDSPPEEFSHPQAPSDH